MTLETEVVLDRRRMRRQLSYWRAFAVLAALVTGGAYLIGSERLSDLTAQKQIARISIEGTIKEERNQLKMLKRIADSAHVEALLVHVNSPGGTTTGGEALFLALREVAKKKPVVAQFGTLAASAGYIAGLGSDHIVARGNTVTGSVGVIMQWPELVQLFDKLGLKMNEIKSGPLKASPSPFQPLDEGGRKVTEAMVADSFKWFLGLVEERRGIKVADVEGLKDGRIFSGREAVALKLVDEIGGEAEAVRWLEEKKGIAKKRKIVDWKPKRDDDWGVLSISSAILGGIFGSAGAEVSQFLAQDRTFSTLTLDGLVSVWHPSEK